MQCRKTANEQSGICRNSTLCWLGIKLCRKTSRQLSGGENATPQWRVSKSSEQTPKLGSTSGTGRSVQPLMELTASQWRLSACEPLHSWISQGAQDHKINPTIIPRIFWFWAIIIWMCELCAQNEEAECWSVVIKIVMNFLFQKWDFASCLLQGFLFLIILTDFFFFNLDC